MRLPLAAVSAFVVPILAAALAAPLGAEPEVSLADCCCGRPTWPQLLGATVVAELELGGHRVSQEALLERRDAKEPLPAAPAPKRALLVPEFPSMMLPARVDRAIGAGSLPAAGGDLLLETRHQPCYGTLQGQIQVAWLSPSTSLPGEWQIEWLDRASRPQETANLAEALAEAIACQQGAMPARLAGDATPVGRAEGLRWSCWLEAIGLGGASFLHDRLSYSLDELQTDELTRLEAELRERRDPEMAALLERILAGDG